jgi:hypothetical protein
LKETVFLFLTSSSSHWSNRTTKRNPNLCQIWPNRSSTPLQTKGITPRSTRVSSLDLQLYRGDGRTLVPHPHRSAKPPEKRGKSAEKPKTTLRREGEEREEGGGGGG